MNRFFPALLLPALLIAMPSSLQAKCKMVKITIEGDSLKAPIEITDAHLLQQFNVWAGAGSWVTSPKGKITKQTDGFIVDWSRSAVAQVPGGLRHYEVSFYAYLRKVERVYVVSYDCDAASGDCFVYLPALDEPWGSLNMSTIYRGVEGHWFHASRAWQNAAQRCMAKTRWRETALHAMR